MTAVRLNLVVLRAADIDSTAAFYRHLGIDFRKHRHGNGPEHYAAELGPTVFEIYPQQKTDANSGAARIGFQVASVDTIIAALQSVGAEIVTPPQDSPWGRRAVAADPDGHRVELTERSEAVS